MNRPRCRCWMPARCSLREGGSILRTRRRLRGWQMFHAIFFAVASDAKLEIGIAQFRRTANGAFVKRLRLVPPTVLKSFAAARHFLTMFRSRKKLRTEKDQII